MTPVTFSLSGYIATGMRITLAVAAFLIVVALAIVVGSRAFATRNLRVEDVS